MWAHHPKGVCPRMDSVVVNTINPQLGACVCVCDVLRRSSGARHVVSLSQAFLEESVGGAPATGRALAAPNSRGRGVHRSSSFIIIIVCATSTRPPRFSSLKPNNPRQSFFLRACCSLAGDAKRRNRRVRNRGAGGERERERHHSPIKIHSRNVDKESSDMGQILLRCWTGGKGGTGKRVRERSACSHGRAAAKKKSGGKNREGRGQNFVSTNAIISGCVLILEWNQNVFP
jgi:hypothetical protein